MIAGKNFFDQPIKNDLKTYDNIRKIATGQDDDYTTECLLDYPYFKKHKLIVINLSKHSKAIEQINFTENLSKAEDATMFFTIEETKETVLEIF